MSGDPFNVTNIDVESDLRREIEHLREAYNDLQKRHERAIVQLAKAESQLTRAMADLRGLS